MVVLRSRLPSYIPRIVGASVDDDDGGNGYTYLIYGKRKVGRRVGRVGRVAKRVV